MQVVMLKLTRHIALLSKIKIIAESGNSKVEKLVMTVKFRQYFLILILDYYFPLVSQPHNIMKV